MNGNQPATTVIRNASWVIAWDEKAGRDVFIDGMKVVRDGTVLSIDLEATLDVLQEAQARSLCRTPEFDWAGRSADELAPMAPPFLETK